MKSTLRNLGLAMLFICSAAFGAGGESSETTSSSGDDIAKDPVIRAAKEGIAKKDWLGTQVLLKKAIASNPKNADYHNLLGYTTRKGPNPDMSLVFSAYAEALRIDPKHRGAREYLGEAYLQINDLAKAKEQLALLSKICTFGCEEYSDLKQSIKQYESTHPK